MKIIHICLSNFYIDGYSYQENEIVARNVLDGHDVLVIASLENFDANKKICYVEPRTYMGTDGAKVIRLPYRKFFHQKIMRKLRFHPGVYGLINDFSPDVILFHGMCGWELITVSRYVKNNSKVKLYVDTHADANNSAATWFSKYILHYLFYRSVLNFCLDSIEKILCVSISVMEFSRDLYGVPKDKLEFFPLGGEILDDNEYRDARKRVRSHYGIKEGDLLFIQSGKFDSKKKLSDSLRAISKNNSTAIHFFITGYLSDELKEEVEGLIQRDSRVQFLGWKNPSDLRDLLCAADVYLQPGSQSATMQMSICSRCIVILDDVGSHLPYVSGNGWLVGRDLSLQDAIHNVVTLSADEIALMSNNSYKIARSMLDYRVLSNRICQ